MSFADLNLHPSILRALTEAGYENPTPIQAQAIPESLQGRDVLASAQTGTGKTAAFTLPALNLLAEPHPVRSRGPRILVLTPTRELADQVNTAARKYGKFLRARCISIVGGMPYPLQNKLLSQPIDILVATPGRFIDHLERGRIDLSRLQMLVLDEADRMLDMGFMPDVERICEALPAERQTLLFSATLDGIMDIGKRFLRDPVTIQVAGQKDRHANIEQRLHFVDDMNHKNKLLEHLLVAPEVNQAIIFTSTKRHADLLAEDLYAAGHQTAALHGDMTQGARNRTLTKLRHGDVKVLVATDVAARGIDVQGISHVINYDLPKFAEDYVHRIGRTGRANNTGIAISFASSADRHLLRKIEQFTGHKFSPEVIAGFEPKRAVRMDDGPRGGKRNGKPQGKGGFRRDERGGRRDERAGERTFGDRAAGERSFGERSFGERSFGDRAAREGGQREHAPRDAGQRSAGQRNFTQQNRAPREQDNRFGNPERDNNGNREVNGNSKHYNKDTDFQFARALTEEFGSRRPRSQNNARDHQTRGNASQERFGNPNAARSSKPRAGKSFGGESAPQKRPRSFV